MLCERTNMHELMRGKVAQAEGRTHPVQEERNVDLAPDLATRTLVQVPRDDRKDGAEEEAL